MPLGPLSRVVPILVIVAALAGCYNEDDAYALKSEISSDDGRTIFELLLTQPKFKEVADRVAPVAVRVEVLYPSEGFSDTFDYRYSDGAVTYIADGGGAPDFTLKTSEDVALGVLNADDGFHVFACAMTDNAATLEATNLIYAASFNGAKGRILSSAGDCHADPGEAVTYRGLNGTLAGSERFLVARMNHPTGEWDSDFLVFNKWRAPTGWANPILDLLCSAASDVAADLCTAHPATSVPSTELNDCAEAVRTTYLADVPPAGGWDAGAAAARASREAAENALCDLTFGGRA